MLTNIHVIDHRQCCRISLSKQQSINQYSFVKGVDITSLRYCLTQSNHKICHLQPVHSSWWVDQEPFH